MLEAVKLALRITTDAFDNELNDLIAACRADMQLCGIVSVMDSDPLIVQAVKLYCKGYFGFDADREKYITSYNYLKASLQMDGDHNGSE